MRFGRAGFFCGGGYFFQTVNAARAQQQLRAFRAKRDGSSRAKTAGGARDEHPFVLERKPPRVFHAKFSSSLAGSSTVRLSRAFAREICIRPEGAAGRPVARREAPPFGIRTPAAPWS